MTTLTDFLLARIAEDEAAAQAAFRPEAAAEFNPPREDDGKWSTGRWSVDEARVEGNGITIYDEGGHTRKQAEHIARHDPARVLAECEAKRRIVEECRALIDSFGDWDAEVGARAMWSDVSRRERSQAHGRLSTLASVYADHPDFQDDWRS